jgi:hypothetical protein
MTTWIQVDAKVYRGPRPKPAEFPEVKATFARVISLEGLAEDRKESDELWPVLILSEPISAWQIYVTGISQGSLTWILEEIDAAVTFGRVLVHCEHGEDRTGLVIAAYRVRHCGWSKECAMAEALQFGYRKWLNVGLNRTWSEFDRSPV